MTTQIYINLDDEECLVNDIYESLISSGSKAIKKNIHIYKKIFKKHENVTISLDYFLPQVLIVLISAYIDDIYIFQVEFEKYTYTPHIKSMYLKITDKEIYFDD